MDEGECAVNYEQRAVDLCRCTDGDSAAFVHILVLEMEMAHHADFYRIRDALREFIHSGRDPLEFDVADMEQAIRNAQQGP